MHNPDKSRECIEKLERTSQRRRSRGSYGGRAGGDHYRRNEADTGGGYGSYMDSGNDSGGW